VVAAVRRERAKWMPKDRKAPMNQLNAAASLLADGL
jgi:hypothetical protein